MAEKIFISYRRDDSKGETRSIYQWLERTFGQHRLFMDVDTIESGENFRNVLDKALLDCKAMLVVIGRHWLSLPGGDGKPRLESPDDFVNVEVASALKRGVPLIPVLVDGAKMPSATELPASLKALASRQAAIVTHENFSTDMERIERRLSAIVPSRGSQKRRQMAWIAGILAVVGLSAATWWGTTGSVRGSIACASERFGARTPEGTSPATTITFTNRTGSRVRIFWLDRSGERVAYLALANEQSANQPTFVGHVWLATDANNNCLGLYTAGSSGTNVVVR
jgi:hypothetical protein